MKRKSALLALLMAAVLMLGTLTACGGKPDTTDTAAPDAGAPDASAAAPADSSEDWPEVTIMFGHVMSEDSTHQDTAEYIKQAVYEATNGTVHVEIYANSTLGTEAQMVEGMMSGTVDMVTVGASTMTSWIPDFGIYDLPYMFKSYEHANAVWESPIGQNIEKQMNDLGIQVVATGTFGYRNLTNSVRPVASPEDVAGLKVRVMQSPIPIAIWEAFGAEVVSMSINEVFSALQTKVVDGQENPYNAIWSNGFAEVQKYLSNTEHQYTMLLYTVSDIALNKMADGQREAFLEACKGVSDASVESLSARDQAALDSFAAAGVAVNDVDKDAFEAAAQSVIEQYYDVYGEENIKLIKTIGEDY